MFGGAGDDIGDGGVGYDLLNGGAGADAFLFGHGSGKDVIGDFRMTGRDILQLAAARIGTAGGGAQVMARYGIAIEAGSLLDFGTASVLLEGGDIATAADRAALAVMIGIF